MFKKAISILLACLLIVTTLGVTVVSVAAADAQQSAAAADLTVTADSNIFKSFTKTVDSAADEVTVTYFVQNSDLKIMNAQWELQYDPEYLQLIDTDGVNYELDGEDVIGNMMPFAGDDGVYNINFPGKVICNMSKLNGYKMNKSGEKVGFVTATFKPVKAGETTVYLDTQVVTLKDSNGEYPLVDESAIVDNTITYAPANTQSSVYEGGYDPTVENPEEDPTTEPATTEPEQTEPVTTECEQTDPEQTEPEQTEPVTTAPVVTDYLKVTATSNFFPETTAYYYDPIAETVTVDYSINLGENYTVVDGQFEIVYDPEVLQFNEADNQDEDEETTVVPFTNNKKGTAVVTNFSAPGDLIVNFTNYKGIPTTKDGEVAPIAQVTFKVIGKGSTTVDLKVSKFEISEKGKETEVENWIVADADLDNYQESVKQIQDIADGSVETGLSPASKDPIEVPEEDKAVYTIAGSSNLVATGWSEMFESEAKLTKGDDGKYSYTFKDVEPSDGMFLLKVLEWPNGDSSEVIWVGVGDDKSLNYEFELTETCDVTVTYDPETKEITVTGSGVKAPEFNVDAIYAVGNGEDKWLNGIAWDPAAEDNKMEEVIDNVYMIMFDDVTEFDNWEAKFAAGSWDINWGCDKNAEKNVQTLDGQVIYSGDAKYNGDNITFAVPYESAQVALQLDLTGFDPVTKSGAKYTIVVTDESAFDEVEVSASFPENFDAKIENDGETVTVTFYGFAFSANAKIISTQFDLGYDSEYLELASIEMPFVTGESDSRLDPVFNTELTDMAKGSVSDLKGFSSFDPAYLVATFNIVEGAKGNTTVDLDVTDLLIESVVPEPETSEPVETETTEPVTTVEPETSAPEDTTVEVGTTSPDATGSTEEVTDAPETTKAATSDSATKDQTTVTPNPSAIQTGSVSMAIIVLLVLLSGTAAIFFIRRRQSK